jgi:hypothetical protein
VPSTTDPPAAPPPPTGPPPAQSPPSTDPPDAAGRGFWQTWGLNVGDLIRTRAPIGGNATRLRTGHAALSGPVEIAVLCVLAAISAGLLYHRLLPRGGFYIALDSVSIQVPFRTFIERTVSLGQLPTWVPNLWMGAPFLANGDAALLYPLQLPFFLFGPERGLSWNIWLHSSLSIVSAYALARFTLGVRPPAAFAAGLAFAFGGYALTHTGLLWAVYEAPWPPLVLLSLERATNQTLRWAVLMPVAVALALLAGNPQELYYCSVWFALIGVVIWFQAPGLARAARIAGTTVAGYVGGFLLAAAQILPQLQLVALGYRAGSGLSFAEAILAELPRISIRDLLLPTGLLYSAGENAGWVGLIGVLLAALGIARFFVGRTRALTGCLVVMAVGSYLLALGDATPLFRLVFDWLPGMHLFRIPVRWLYPMSIAVAMLVGQGADITIDQAQRVDATRLRSPKRMAATATLSLAIGVLAVTSLLDAQLVKAWGGRVTSATALYVTVALAAFVCGMVVPRRGQAAALGLVLAAGVGIELYGLAQPLEWNHPAATDVYAEQHPVPAYVATHEPGRVLSLAPDAPNVAVLRDDTPLSVGASSVTGYSTPWPTSLNEPLGAVVDAAAYGDDGAFTSRTAFWHMIGVRYVVASAQRQGLARDPSLAVRARDGQWVLYELTGQSSRVTTYCGAEVGPDGPAVAAAVLQPAFSADRLYVDAPGDRSSSSAPCGSAQITGERVDTVHAAVDMPQPGWLLLTDSWYPGWEVAVDGKMSQLRQADHFFKAVRVPAGVHAVTFRFDPPVFHIGVAISAAASVLWLGAMLFAASGLRHPLAQLGPAVGRARRRSLRTLP